MAGRHFQESIIEAIHNVVYTKVPQLHEEQIRNKCWLDILVEQSHDSLDPFYVLRLRLRNGKIIWQTRTRNYSKLLSDATMAQLALVSNSLSCQTISP